MKKLILIFGLIGVSNLLAQSVLNDNFSTFNIANLSNQGGWKAATPSAGAGLGECFSLGCNVQVVNKTMTYVGFGSSTKAANGIAGTTGDAPGKFLTSPVTTGSIYVTMLLNLTEPSGTLNTQFIRLIDNGFNSATRLYSQKIGSGAFKFGVDKAGSSASQTSATYSYGQDMLVVLKYTYNTGSTTDDQVTLYVNPNITTTEVLNTPALTFTSSTTDATTITRVALSWSVTSQTTSGFLGAISASTLWGATLPNAIINNIQINKTSANNANVKFNVENGSLYKSFNIQQSNNQTNYYDVISFNNDGDKEYTQNISLYNGSNFIRIKSTDFNGKEIYTNVLVSNGGSILLGGLSVSPNPTKGQLFVNIKTNQVEDVRIQITDLQGRILVQQTKKVDKGENTISIDATNLKQGNYVLKAIWKEGVETKLFIKQ